MTSPVARLAGLALLSGHSSLLSEHAANQGISRPILLCPPNTALSNRGQNPCSSRCRALRPSARLRPGPNDPSAENPPLSVGRPAF
jgi:hypothetical protein